jgi:hypothetical protein
MSEISGILKNGIERGWQFEEIKQSLLNAGYNEKEIETELLVFKAKPIASIQLSEGKEKFDPQKLNNYQTAQVTSKKSFSLMLFVIIFLTILIAVGAGLFFALF